MKKILNILSRLFIGDLRRQLITGVAVVHAVMMVLFVWDLTERQSKLLLERQVEQASALARSVATSSAGWVASRDYYGLQEIVTAQSRYPELVFAMVLNTEGRVLAHTDLAHIGDYLSDLPHKSEFSVLFKQAQLVDVASPIMLSGQHIGWSRVGLGQQDTAEKLAEIKRDGFLYAIAAIVIGSILAWFMGVRLTGKLHQIQQAADAIEQGELTKRVTLSGDDEINHMANAFNRMLDSLHDARKTLVDANHRLNIATIAAKIGIWEYDIVNQKLEWDERMFRMHGISKEDFSGLFGAWESVIHPEDLEMTREKFRLARDNIESFDYEYRIIRDKDKIAWIKVDAISIGVAGEPIKLIGACRDITEKKERDRLITFQANYDSLTSLPNRKLLDELLRQEIKVADRTSSDLWVFFLDLDGFKEVNDTFGHAIGDALLIRVAERITACLRSVDIVARLSGDEFVIVLSETSKSYYVDNIAAKLVREMALPFNVAGKEIFVTVSIGIANYPKDARSIIDLLKFADQSMYEAKKHGKNRYTYFTRSLQDISLRRQEISTDLRKSLVAEEFELYYQPIVDLKTGEVMKAEALIRWNHPVKGMVSPGEFIPIAEETGIISELGEWIFESVFRKLGDWCKQVDGAFQVSINMSPNQFKLNEEQFNEWAQKLESFQIKGSCVVIEITEGLLLKNDPVVNRRLLKFRDMGIQVAIDDFGTGYSSLAYLKVFDIDYLKIDQSFVRGLEAGSSESALPHAIIVMAHQLGLKVIAEGIETEEEFEILKQMGCDYGQGYLFSRPIPSDEYYSSFIESKVLLL